MLRLCCGCAVAVLLPCCNQPPGVSHVSTAFPACSHLFLPFPFLFLRVSYLLLPFPTFVLPFPTFFLPCSYCFPTFPPSFPTLLLIYDENAQSSSDPYKTSFATQDVGSTATKKKLAHKKLLLEGGATAPGESWVEDDGRHHIRQ